VNSWISFKNGFAFGKSRLRNLLNRHAVSKFTQGWLSLHSAGNEKELKTAFRLVDAIVSGQIEEKDENLPDTGMRKFYLPKGVSWLHLSEGESIHVRPGWPEFADCIISRIQEKNMGMVWARLPVLGKQSS